MQLLGNTCDKSPLTSGTPVASLDMNSTRVMYVENDSALRQFLQDSLKDQPGIELIGIYSDGISALNRAVAKKADVALIDFGLDTDGLNGIELGIALREINEYIGIVIYSQFNVRKMVNRVPPAMRNGWSFFEKSGEMSAADYAKILKDTAIGKGNWEEFFPSSSEANEADLNPYYELTSRQRSIISLLAQGISVQEISLRLDLTYAYVRKELSRAYDILLPEAKESDDLKTLAILKYLQLVKTI
ncbi:CitB Response regulator containing a CheY-like receiver domain and an HTH DNA-binding domain [Candidatus Nanopelagicaceae bacterium]